MDKDEDLKFLKEEDSEVCSTIHSDTYYSFKRVAMYVFYVAEFVSFTSVYCSHWKSLGVCSMVN